MNKNEKLELNYNEALIDEKKEAWMDNLAKLLTNIEALEKLQDRKQWEFLYADPFFFSSIY